VDEADLAPDLFQSTLPVRGATAGVLLIASIEGVSIHAPGEGSDRRSLVFVAAPKSFNPRSR